jgi:hypothetical protein
MKAVLAAAAFLLAQVVSTTPVEKRLAYPPQLRKRWGMKAQTDVDIDLVGNGTFTQLLDHTNPAAGTFKQRYWWDASNWKGKGSPVFLFNCGEDNADEYVFLPNRPQKTTTNTKTA